MKGSKCLIIYCVLMVTLMIPFMANAEENDKRFYTNVKAGVYIPSDRASDADYDTGFSSELSAGYHIFPRFAIEAGVGYFDTNITLEDITVLGVADGSLDVSVIPITLSAIWFSHLNRSSLYVGGGLGAYYQMIDGDVDTSFGGTFEFDDQDTVFGFHVLIGFLYNMNQNLYLGLEWTTMLLNESEFESRNSSGQARIKPDLDGDLLTVVFGMRF